MPKNQILLNGSTEAKKILKNLKSKISNLKSTIGLATILIGNNPASQVYINIKEKRAKEIGVNFKKYLLPASVSEKKVLDLINKLNNNKNIHGILVQLPLPKKINTQKIIKKININKDVDGFVSKKIIPPTIQAIIRLIKLSNIKLKNKKVLAHRSFSEGGVILANSLEFAESVEKELKNKKIKTKILLKPKKANYKKYDIIIIALGKKHWLKPEMIKKDSIIIDVGINKNNPVKSLHSHGVKNSNKIYGDVHPDCFKKTKYISPVPGGVGPLTVVFLFKNLIKLYKK